MGKLRSTMRMAAPILYRPRRVVKPAARSAADRRGRVLGQVASQTRRERPGSPRRTQVYVEGYRAARNEVWRRKLAQYGVVKPPLAGYRHGPGARVPVPVHRAAPRAEGGLANEA